MKAISLSANGDLHGWNVPIYMTLVLHIYIAQGLTHLWCGGECVWVWVCACVHVHVGGCAQFYYNYTCPFYYIMYSYYMFPLPLFLLLTPSLSLYHPHSSSFSQHFFVQLQNWTGQDEVNMTNVFRIADIIRIHNVHNLSSYTPWATEEVRSKLYLISVYNLKLLFATAEMSRLACGECVCMCVCVRVCMCVCVCVCVYMCMCLCIVKDVTILVLHIYSLQASWSTRSWMKCVWRWTGLAKRRQFISFQLWVSERLSVHVSYHSSV